MAEKRTFVLRCWQESYSLNEGEPNGPLIWHFALVQADDHSQTNCFACLDELVAYLRKELPDRP